jgi:hypothetical protein
MENREVLLRVGTYALIKIEGELLTNYVVASYYNEEDGTWAYGHYFNATTHYESDNVFALMEASEYLYSKIDPEYISRERMSEIATRFKDNLDYDGLEYAIDDLEMEDYEKEYFEIEMETDDDDDEED